MNCTTVHAILSGEAPVAPIAGHLSSCASCRTLSEGLEQVDVLARSLPPIEPPDVLVARVLDVVEAENTVHEPASDEGEARPSRARDWFRWTWAPVLVAAGLLLTFSTPQPSPSELVEKGVGEALPGVTLKVAVERRGQTSRLRRDQSCVEGDRLYFRVSTSAPAHVVLVRVDALGAEILHEQQLDGGEQDLGLEGPLAWQVEAHESDAVFAVLASPEHLNPEDVEGALGATYNSATATCGSAPSLGARCDEVAVRISP